ncbi:unnamed protein product, partial [Phaeothamnion confervicola]
PRRFSRSPVRYNLKCQPTYRNENIPIIAQQLFTMPPTRRRTAHGILLIAPSVLVAAASIDYEKPTVSSETCVETAASVKDKTTEWGNGGSCMGCDPTLGICPPGCQALVDQLYQDCDGVTMPDGLYYDPDSTIDGAWDDTTRSSIKIAVGRCGCNAAARTAAMGGV